MAKSPSDFGAESNIGFDCDVPGNLSYTEADAPDNVQDFSPYADDTSEPTSPQSGAGYRSRLWGEDTKQIGTNRIE